MCEIHKDCNFTLAHWCVLWYLNMRETPILPKKLLIRLSSFSAWHTEDQNNQMIRNQTCQISNYTETCFGNKCSYFLFKSRVTWVYLCQRRQQRAVTACLCSQTGVLWQCDRWFAPLGWDVDWIDRWTWKPPPSASSPPAWYKADRQKAKWQTEHKTFDKLTKVIY